MNRVLSIVGAALLAVTLSACMTANPDGSKRVDIEQTMDNACLALKGAEGLYQVVLTSKPELLSVEDKRTGEYAKAIMNEVCKKPYPSDLNTAIAKAIDVTVTIGQIVAKANATPPGGD